MKMKWVKNNTNNIINSIDYDSIINRLSYALQINKSQLLKKINLDTIKSIVSNIVNNNKLDIDFNINNIQKALTNPYDIINLEKAAIKISKYLNNKEASIFIYADYDCDGIMSAYILYSILKEIGCCNIYVYCPERKDGYGINIDFCNKVINLKNNNILVITVDNGITKKDEIKLLQDNNIEVIITDHHPSKENETPNCLIVDPHNKDTEQDEFKHLCGAELAFKLGQILKDIYNQLDIIKYTPYIALAILSDVMELNNENIALLQYGMEIINSNNCPPAIKSIMDLKQINILSYKDILWTITPIINACGRMNNTQIALDLFLYQYDYDITDIVKEIDNINENRKKLTKELIESFNMFDFSNDKVCILPLNNCPAGLLGILAGKAVEQFNKPSIVLSSIKDNIYHGSVRSFNNIDMVNLFKQMKNDNLIIDYAGHSEACVCTLDINKLTAINEFFNNNISDDLFIISEDIEKELNINSEITLDMINKYVYTLINLIPYDNKKYYNPIYELNNVQVKGYKISKNNSNNIMFTLKEKDKKKTIDIWAWGFADKYLKDLKCPEYINIAGEISKNLFDNSYTLQIVDIMEA